MLDDVSSLKFTDAQIDTAVRTALIFYNRLRPLQRSYYLDTTGEAVLSLPLDVVALMVTRVQLFNSGSTIPVAEVLYKASRINEQWVIECVHGAYPVGQVLGVQYACDHTIDGLDGGAGTTIDDDNLLILGAAGYACQSRAISRAESINMQPGVQSQLEASAQSYLTLYYTGLRSSPGLVGVAF
jgi:hypothetical protein